MVWSAPTENVRFAPTWCAITFAVCMFLLSTALMVRSLPALTPTFCEPAASSNITSLIAPAPGDETLRCPVTVFCAGSE